LSTHNATVPIPVEPPEVEARVLAVGSYLVAGATAFFFVAFLFAFLYLRALNNNGRWGGGQPGRHVHPALTVGIVVLVCVLASVVLVRLALTELRKQATTWRLAGIAALLLGLAAVGVQCWQYTDLGFGPGDGGYASVYLAWTGFFSIFVFGTMYWLETILASTRRPDSVPQAPLEASVGGLSLVWTVLGLVEIAAFVLLFGVQ
jgi:heme/copper-type cytochrome/quinol oxidase subunit 3